MFGEFLSFIALKKSISLVPNTKKSENCRTCWHPCLTTFSCWTKVL